MYKLKMMLWHINGMAPKRARAKMGRYINTCTLSSLV